MTYQKQRVRWPARSTSASSKSTSASAPRALRRVTSDLLASGPHGRPEHARLLPHIDAAAAAGAKYPVIDTGWHAAQDGNWWDSVGAREPAPSCSPGERGIHEALDRIRGHGMVPGL